MRTRQVFTARVEPYVYYHSVCPGFQVRRRRVVITNGVPLVIADINKYFSVGKCGSKKAAKEKALNWKRRNLKRLMS